MVKRRNVEGRMQELDEELDEEEMDEEELDEDELQMELEEIQEQIEGPTGISNFTR